jgi:glutaredoxin
MKKILLFTINGCLQCRDLKTKLDSQSISFIDIEITKNRELWNQVVEQTGYDTLPTVFIQNDNDGSGTVYIPGRDFQDIDEIIKIIKNNI